MMLYICTTFHEYLEGFLSYGLDSKIDGWMGRRMDTVITKGPLPTSFGRALKIFRMALLLLKENNYAKIFEIYAQMYKVWLRQIRTDGPCTHMHQTKIVNSVLLSASGLDKNWKVISS